MSLLFSTGVIAASGLAKGAPGMVLVKPTSIAHTGTSASIGANGQVTFTSITVLSLNGIFSADYDNYALSIRYDNVTASPSSFSLEARLRASGSDASGSDYSRQRVSADSTSATAARTVSQNVLTVGRGGGDPSGDIIYVYGPFLSTITTVRNDGVDSSAGAIIGYNVGIHSLTTSYDGFTFLPGSGQSISGTVSVYGIRS